MGNRVKLNIKGKNLNLFIKRLYDNNINIYKVENKDGINIIIDQKDYDKLIKLKTIYEITQVDVYGIIKVKKIVNRYKYILVSLLISLFLIAFLSNVIFDIEIIHENSNLRALMLNELESNNLKKHTFKKDYNDIQLIKKSILEKYKDKLEWIEIENIGTKYIVRLEERIIKDDDVEKKNQDIIAKKSAIVKKIIAEKGDIIKETNQFVKKGDTIISGTISLNENIKEIVPAIGTVFGEVWYTVTVEYPYVYSERIETGNVKNNIVLRILNKDFSFNSYKEKIVNDRIILENNLIPIKLINQTQRELKINSIILTKDEAINYAIEESIKKMKSLLDKDEEILDYKLLSCETNDKVIVKVFFNILENITEYKEIG